MKTYTSSDRNATPTAPARPLRPNLAEAMTWTPRPVEEPRPTASGYEPPTPEDRLWYESFELALDGINAPTPEGLSRPEADAWERGAEAGDRERWADFGLWLDEQEEAESWADRVSAIYEAEMETETIEEAERVGRLIHAAWGGHGLD